MNEMVELTPYQKNIWNMHTVMKDTAVCNLGGYIYSTSMTDYEIWQKVMCSVIRKCSVLRLRFTPDGHQYNTEYEGYELPYYDRRGRSEGEIIEEMRSWMHSKKAVENVSLCDCRYVKSDSGMYMFGRFCHLTLDGVSFVMLMQNMEKMYMEFAQKGQEDTEPENNFWQECLTKQGKLFAEESRTKYREICQQEVKGWKSKPVLKRTENAGIIKRMVPESLNRKVKKFAKENRISVETLLFTAGAILMDSYGGYGETVIGRSVLNRKYSQLKTMGMYVNTQVVRVKTEGRAVKDILSKTGIMLMDMLKRGGYSFSDWKRDVGLDGAVFDLVISYRSPRFLPKMEHAEIRELENLSMEIPVCLKWNEEETETEAVVLYCAYGWKDIDAERFLERIFTVLEQITEKTEQAASCVNVFCEEDRTALKKMQGGNWTYTKSVAEQFLENIRNKREEAVIEDEEGILTGKDILLLCENTVAYLEEVLSEKNRNSSHGKGLIGIALPRSRYLPVLMMSVMIAGYGFFPINEKDSVEMQEEAGKYCEYVITKSVLEEILLEIAHNAVPADRLMIKAYRIEKEDIAYGISTSGTMGEPKIAQNTQEGLACRLDWMSWYFGKGGQYLQKTRKTFDVSIWELLLPLIDGGRLFVAEDGKEADVTYLSEVLQRKKITKVHFVPSVLPFFLRYIQMKQLEFPYLEALFCSGEALLPELAGRIKENLPGVKLYNLYGPAECAIDVSVYSCKGGEEQIPIGQPVPGTELYVLNQRGEKMPPGVEGEICIVGKQTGLGYLETSAARKEQDRFFLLEGEKAYRTGDRGKYGYDNQLYFLGRMDCETKIRGMRINPEKVEREIGQCPGVLKVAVCKNKNRLVALYVSDSGQKINIRDWCCRHLPDYSVPDMIIRVDELPWGKHGKLDRTKLEEIIAGTETDKEKIQEADGACKELVEKIQKALEKQLSKSVKPKDSVFEAGLTSLGAVEFVLDLNSMGISLTYQDIYRAQTPEAIAQMVSQKSAGQQEENQNVVVLRESRNPKDIFVCFPYAGGGPECFERFAEGFGKADVQVWAACNIFVEKELKRLALFVPKKSRVHVMGYCGGASAAFAFLDILKKTGRKADTFWLCAAYPHKNLKLFGKEFTVWDIMPQPFGKRMLGRIYGGTLPVDKSTYHRFRKEIRAAQSYMERYQSVHNVPAYLIYGEEDPLTPNYKEKYGIYHRYIKHNFTICKIPKAGHYFMEKSGKKLGHYAMRELSREERT